MPKAEDGSKWLKKRAKKGRFRIISPGVDKYPEQHWLNDRGDDFSSFKLALREAKIIIRLMVPGAIKVMVYDDQGRILAQGRRKKQRRRMKKRS